MPVDAVGTLHAPLEAGAPLRIVSLVPSLTELLCDLGLAPYMVGRTGFCIHPRQLVQAIDKVGGTKDVNIDRIRALAPTHLVVNIDENEQPTVAMLATFIPHVIVTHPNAPRDNLDLYCLFGELFACVPGVAERAAGLCAAFEAEYARLPESAGADSSLAPRRVLYVIWQDPWMTVTRATYIAQMLALIGWQQWHKPAPAGMPPSPRYPQFAWSAELLDAIDLVLLSSEPYSFRQKHADELAARFGKPVLLVDGERLSWYGSRAIAGLAYLQELRAIADGPSAPACG